MVGVVTTACAVEREMTGYGVEMEMTHWQEDPVPISLTAGVVWTRLIIGNRVQV